MGNSIIFTMLGKDIKLSLEVVTVCEYFIFSNKSVYILFVQGVVKGLSQHKLLITYFIL